MQLEIQEVIHTEVSAKIKFFNIAKNGQNKKSLKLN